METGTTPLIAKQWGFSFVKKMSNPTASLVTSVALLMLPSILNAEESAASIPTPEAFIVTRNSEWIPFEHSVEIVLGGVFDFSHLSDAPAGKHGSIRTTSAGHFEFEKRPGHRVRFWGPNLTFSANYLEKNEADRLAERFVRSGYNTVRFHHFDGELVSSGEGGRGPSWELNPKKIDQLDYLFAAMKKRGIYVNIDLFSLRGFSDAELVSFGLESGMEVGQTFNIFKGLVPVSDAAFESWARFARNLLTHRNPYTGLTWAEDPALIGICPLNEDQMVNLNRINHPPVLELYRKKFIASGGSSKEVGKDDSIKWNRFIHDIRVRSDKRIFAYLRSLGTKTLLTGTNDGFTQGLSLVRQHYDYVDNHRYWDHPKFPQRSWQPPYAFHQNSSVSQTANSPRVLMPTRIFGLPFTVTEFNFCRPNRHRAEGAILMPAYASLQDWDGLYNFQYAESRETALNGGVDNYFSLACDPIGLVADRLGAFLFLRGDIAPAPGAIAWAVRAEEAWSKSGQGVPESFSQLGLVTRIGSISGQPAEVQEKHRDKKLAALATGDQPALQKPLPPRTYIADKSLAARLQYDGVLPAGSIDAESARFISETGQIELNAAARSVKVVTPRSELFLLAADAGLTGAHAKVRNTGASDAMIGVVALDGLSLNETRRILVIHLTDAIPAGARFLGKDGKLLESWGSGPHLVRRGEATLALNLPESGSGAWEAWSVDATGARVSKHPIRTVGGEVLLNLSTKADFGARIACELAR